MVVDLSGLSEVVRVEDFEHAVFWLSLEAYHARGRLVFHADFEQDSDVLDHFEGLRAALLHHVVARVSVIHHSLQHRLHRLEVFLDLLSFLSCVVLNPTSAQRQ